MKKIISVLLCISIVLTFTTVNSFAGDKNVWFGVADSFGEVGGAFVSVFTRFFNKLSNKDESKINEAEEQKVNWKTVSADLKIDNPEATINAETWVANELSYVSTKTYADPFNDVTLDLVLFGNGREYTIPAFWDGGNTWKIRFACPSAGEWYFKTICSDTDNAALHNRTGKIICKEYDGEYEIYQNGFVTTKECKKYFTYDDGTPFLYLGDTHWSLGDETVDMVKIIAQKRAEQGFTVIQSEPIGAKFIVENGITNDDMAGFKDYDDKFKAIADNGLVHANAEFFFPYYMGTLIDNFGGYSENYSTVKIDKKDCKLYDISDTAKAYLEKLARYWVARYSAYPVMWTLGQEVDDDFYWAIDNHPEWGYANNPYKYLAEYIAKYDPYSHPLSAHQENAGATTAYGNGENTDEKRKVYQNASTSVFYDMSEHTFYASQWSPSKTGQLNFNVPKDYWYNSNGKVAINYEGQYCYLWTKNFGARMQGWTAYLNGLYGYGWGGHDTWSYLNTYDEDNDSTDGLDVVTSQEKINATWQDSLEYESSYQCGYMLDFFSKIEWQELIPRFDNKAYFKPCLDVYYTCASNKDNSEMVIYFYSFNDSSVAQKSNTTNRGAISTGTIGNLEPRGTYHYQWFNPITGEYSEEHTFTATAFGTYFLGQKNNTDMVLHLYK